MLAAAARPQLRHAWRQGTSSLSGTSLVQLQQQQQQQQRQQRSSSLLRSPPPQAAGNSSPGAAADDAADDLPLWALLQQQGFTPDGIASLQAAANSGKLGKVFTTGQRLTEQKLQRNLGANIAALRAEGLDTPAIQRLFEAYPGLLVTTRESFTNALAALHQLAALLPHDPQAVQAPPEATQLGVALWLYPSGSAYCLARANLGSLIDGNLRLRRRLGISDAATAAAIFKNGPALVSDFERAEAMVAHLQRRQAAGALTAQQGEVSVCHMLQAHGRAQKK